MVAGDDLIGDRLLVPRDASRGARRPREGLIGDVQGFRGQDVSFQEAGNAFQVDEVGHVIKAGLSAVEDI